MIPSKRKPHFGSTPFLCAALAACLTSCSDGAAHETGSVELALRGSSKGSDYTLADATFDIEGVEARTLETGGEVRPTLSAELPVGTYSVTLRDGWRLLETKDGTELAVSATLVSQNPQGFDVLANSLTTVSFAFETGDGAVSFGAGSVEVGIDVRKLLARDVVVSEVMKNPVLLSDADGEWLELTNLGSNAVSLLDCRVERDGSGFTIATALTLASGTSITLASSESPGFSPGYVYSGLSLPNSGSFELRLVCGDEELDRLLVDPAVTPNAAGASLSLDLERAFNDGNDDPLTWCDAKTSYNGDLGTPGAANPTCP
jgi:hypothetical protein